MMQAADLRHFNNPSLIRRLHLPWDRTVVGEGSMGTEVVVILEVIFEYESQLLFVQDDDSIEAFSPNGTYQPLGKGILPRRSRGRLLLLDTHALYPLNENRSVNRIAVAQQILGRCVIGERIDDLLGRPRGRG